MSYGLAGGGGGHHGGHHGGGGWGGGGGHHGGHHGYYGGGWGYPYYYNTYPTIYAEPIIITQDIKPDCGSNPCLNTSAECQRVCKAQGQFLPVSGLGTISDGTRNLLIAVGVGIGGMVLLTWLGNRATQTAPY